MPKSESAAVDVPDEATPYGPGEAREEIAVSQMGATFAERAAARAKADGKQVAASDVEDKAVKKASTKAKKKA